MAFIDLKTTKKRFPVTISVLILCLIIVVSSVVFLLANHRGSNDISFTSSGALNLIDWENVDEESVILRRGWTFYPNVLLTPGMVEESRSGNPRVEQYSYYQYVSISTQGWSDMGSDAEFVSIGSNPEMTRHGVGTYYIDLLVDPTLDYLVLNLPSISQAATIWVNGQAKRHFGVLAEDEEHFEPAEICTDIQVEPDKDGHIKILIQCASFTSDFGGMLCSPCIAPSSDAGIIKYTGLISLAVLCTFLVFFIVGGYYISKTFNGKKKLYFYILMFLTDILLEIFSPNITLLGKNWNALLQSSFLILANYWGYLFFFNLHPRGISKFFERIRIYELSLFSSLTTLYLLTYWCFPNLLERRSSEIANLILVLLTGCFNIFRVFYLARKRDHGKLLYILASLIALLMHIAPIMHFQYYLYITFHGFLLIIWAVGFTLYFVLDYVKTYDKLSANVRNLASAVEEKTKYISRVNQDLLKNHEKLLENEEARKKMMSNVSHDLRTPITAIRGYVELMLNAKEPLSRDQEVQYLNNMHTRSVQMEQLISDLVQLTRMESENDTLDKMPISIKEMVGELFQLYHAECEGTEKVITFSAPEDDDLFIDGDPKKLLRVFENIIVNAMKYTKEDGHIDIICHRYDDPAMLDGNAVEVLVKDNGVGIPANEVPYVFDRFYRAENSGINKTGSGLGLSIVKSVMDKHGGKIWAESEEGKGSEFHIVFRSSEFSFDDLEEEEE
ncbi:MAG: hypothetical protein KBT07_07975 [Clostridiales bacterium]|nr:hypothetical protein [Candidatus Scatonaster coprocaballi]